MEEEQLETFLTENVAAHGGRVKQMSVLSGSELIEMLMDGGLASNERSAVGLVENAIARKLVIPENSRMDGFDRDAHFICRMAQDEPEDSGVICGTSSESSAEFWQEEEALKIPPCGIRLAVMSGENPPNSLRGVRASHFYVKVKAIEPSGNTIIEEVSKSHPKDKEGVVSWFHLINLGFSVHPDTIIEFTLHVYHRRTPHEDVGVWKCALKELMNEPVCELVLVDLNTDRVVHTVDRLVTTLHVSVDRTSVPLAWQMKRPKKLLKYSKHLMVVTRGTRGDVQPFVALARALAQNYGWLVTICTELRFKEFIEEQSESLSSGGIQFRLSGGDTQKRLTERLARWAIHRESPSIQHVMMAYAELEFIDSEPAIYHFAETLRPDYLLFGFTMTHVAMIISESLKIPLLGMILQPTCIPSAHYPPLHLGAFPHGTRKGTGIVSSWTNRYRHMGLTSLKMLLESNPMTGMVQFVRKSRRLKPLGHLSIWSLVDIFQGNVWVHLQEQKVPLVVPINELAFGGRPRDWGSSTVFTNFMFLRGKTVPGLDDSIQSFISNAKHRGSKLVVLAFSSMPISMRNIVEIALKILSAEFEKGVAVVALVGDHVKNLSETLQQIQGKDAVELQASGRLIFARGAPYGRLFKEMDVIVAHGGLGSSAEALMAGKPIIITGVLLLDQKFWGRRCHKLGLGPPPMHITKFRKIAVDLILEALRPAEENPWLQEAKKVADQMKASMRNDVDGTALNAACLYQMSKVAPVFSHDGSWLKKHCQNYGGWMRSLWTDNIVSRTAQGTFTAIYGVAHYAIFAMTMTRNRVLGI